MYLILPWKCDIFMRSDDREFEGVETCRSFTQKQICMQEEVWYKVTEPGCPISHSCRCFAGVVLPSVSLIPLALVEMEYMINAILSHQVHIGSVRATRWGSYPATRLKMWGGPRSWTNSPPEWSWK
jgi:hypothetical protein